MRKATLAVLGSLFVLASAATCTIPDLESDGGTCPCASGYDCVKNACVRAHGTTSATGGFGGVGGGVTSSSDGGTTSTANPIGSGGNGGTGGPDCAANGWAEETDPFWDSEDCPDPIVSCSVFKELGHEVLCCEDTASHTTGGGGPVIAAYQQPSTSSEPAGQLWTEVSWFACWVGGEIYHGNRYWLYTQLDLKSPSKWGYIPAATLLGTPPGDFNPLDPSESLLPQCRCPAN